MDSKLPTSQILIKPTLADFCLFFVCLSVYMPKWPFFHAKNIVEAPNMDLVYFLSDYNHGKGAISKGIFLSFQNPKNERKNWPQN